MWKTLTGVHFVRLTMAGLDKGPVPVFAFFDCGPADQRYEIPKFLHIMGEPEALALFAVMQAKLGIADDRPQGGSRLFESDRHHLPSGDICWMPCEHFPASGGNADAD